MPPFTPAASVAGRSAVLIVEDQPNFLADLYLTRLLSTAQLHNMRVCLVKGLSHCAVVENVPTRPWLKQLLGDDRIVPLRFGAADWPAELARAVFARADDPDEIHVSTIFEDYTDVAVRIGESLGARSLIVRRASEDRGWNVRDKAAMRDRWLRTLPGGERYGIEFSVCTELSEAVEAGSDMLRRHPGGIVLKPRALASSYHVKRVTSAAVLPETARRVLDADFVEDLKRHSLAPEGILIEPYCAGPQFSAEVMVSEGRPHVLAIIQKQKGPLANTSFGEMAHILPPRELTAELVGRVRGLAEFVVRSLCIWDSVIHLEFIDDGDRTVPIEVGLRPAGGRIPLLVWAHAGIDLIDLHIQLNLGLRPAVPEPCLPLGGCSCYSALVSAKDRQTWIALKSIGHHVFPSGGDSGGRWGTVMFRKLPWEGVESVLSQACLIPDACR